MADNGSNLKGNDTNKTDDNNPNTDQISNDENDQNTDKQIEQQLKECQEENKRLLSETQSLKLVLEECQKEKETLISDHKNDLDKITEQLSTCEEDLAKKTKELTECQDNLAKKDEEIAKKDKRLETCEAILKTTKEDLARVQKVLEALQATNNSDVNPEFKTFVNEAQFITAEVSKTNESVNNNIVSNFLNQHYERNNEGVYEPKMVRFKIGNSIKQIPSSSLSNNSNLTPCSLSLNYKPKTQEGSLYDIDTNICFDSKGVGFIDKLVASNGETVIDLTPGIPIDNNISRRNLRSTNI